MRWMMLGIVFAATLAAASCGRMGELERPAAFSSQVPY